MGREPLFASLEDVRRLCVTKQHLQGRLPARVSSQAILEVVRDLGYIQWDPVSTVAPSHLLSLWSRTGELRPAMLERLLWKEKRLIEHSTPIASIVLSEDYPIYCSLMSRYPDTLSDSWGAQRERAREFIARHAGLRRGILDEIRRRPCQLKDFQQHARTKRKDGEWTFGSDVSQMLYHLYMAGEVMIVGHEGNQNIWGLPGAFLPAWVERTVLPEEELERTTAQRAIRALGTATASEIGFHYVRGRYLHLERALASLEKDSLVHRVRVDELSDREPRYVHDDDVRTLASIGTRGWVPRMSLLPPFDNMVISQARTKKVFGFDYVREQFLPKERRRFGTYVLPVLWGEKFVGRVDPQFDRASGELRIHAVHAEPDSADDRTLAGTVRETIDRLARFLGAERVVFSPRVPTAWKGSLG